MCVAFCKVVTTSPPFCALQVTQNPAPLGKSQGSVSSPLGKGNDLPFTPNNGDSAP